MKQCESSNWTQTHFISAVSAVYTASASGYTKRPQSTARSLASPMLGHTISFFTWGPGCDDSERFFFLFSVTIGPVCFRSVIPDALPDIPWPSDEGCCPCAPRLPVPFSFDFGGGSSAIVTLPVAPTVAFVRTSAPSAMPFGYACLNVCLNVLNRSPHRSGHLPAL